MVRRRVEIALDLGAGRAAPRSARHCRRHRRGRRRYSGPAAARPCAPPAPSEKRRCASSPAMISSALAPASGMTKAVAFFRSGLTRTSLTVMFASRSAGSRNSAGPQQLGQRVAQLLADAQLPLAGCGRRVIRSRLLGMLPANGVRRSRRPSQLVSMGPGLRRDHGYKARATSSTSKHSITSPCWMFS